jgi:hypothetical protein
MRHPTGRHALLVSDVSALVKPRTTQFSIVSEPPGETNDTLWGPKPAPSSIKP